MLDDIYGDLIGADEGLRMEIGQGFDEPSRLNLDGKPTVREKGCML